jgi:hypothetical protein
MAAAEVEDRVWVEVEGWVWVEVARKSMLGLSVAGVTTHETVAFKNVYLLN